MNQIIDLPSDERAEVFNEAGLKLGLPAYYVEKDFWVCWVLELLFGDPHIGPHLTFRGGTSLSKGWQLIQRFSEDVDLAMSRQWVDPELPNPSEIGINPAQRDSRLRRLRRACRDSIQDEVVPHLTRAAAELGDGARVDEPNLEKDREITPSVAEALSQLGPWPSMQIACVTPARTFLE